MGRPFYPQEADDPDLDGRISNFLYETPDFVPVKVVKHKQVSAAEPILELVCPNGIKLKFYSPINFSELRALIK